MTFALHISGDKPVPQFKALLADKFKLFVVSRGFRLLAPPRTTERCIPAACPIIRSLFCTLCIADVTADMHSIRDCRPLELTLCTQSLHRHGSAKMQRDRISMRLNHVFNAASLFGMFGRLSQYFYFQVQLFSLTSFFSDPLSASIPRDTASSTTVDWRGVAQSETSFRGSVFLRVTSTTS